MCSIFPSLPPFSLPLRSRRQHCCRLKRETVPCGASLPIQSHTPDTLTHEVAPLLEQSLQGCVRGLPKQEYALWLARRMASEKPLIRLDEQLAYE